MVSDKAVDVGAAVTRVLVVAGAGLIHFFHPSGSMRLTGWVSRRIRTDSSTATVRSKP